MLLRFAVLAPLVFPASASAIVGGSTTTKTWPHMAGMEYQEAPAGDWGFRCGGSLIRPDVVLTAAHCVDADDGGTLPASRFRFLLGTNKRSSGGERIAAASVLENPQYDQSGGSAGDVALFKLASPSTLGRTIRVAGAGDAAFWEPGDEATVIGWGTEFSNSPTVPDDLKEAQLPLVADSSCQASYQFTLGFDPATNICAGNLLGGTDSCQGDSGGPLMVQDGSGAWIQVGVVSYGLGCAFPTQYGVYAEAGGDALRGWIEQNATALAAKAAPAPAAGTAPSSGSGGASGGAPTGSSTAATPRRARLQLPARLKLGRSLSATVHTTGALRSLKLTLRRGKRTLATGSRASLRGAAGKVALRRRAKLTAGAATLSLTAVDASGARVSASRAVRLTR